MENIFLVALDNFAKQFGLTMSIIAIITICFFTFLIIRFDKRKLSVKRYEKEKEEHAREHLKLEDDIDKKLEELSVISKVVHEIKGYLFGIEKTKTNQ